MTCQNGVDPAAPSAPAIAPTGSEPTIPEAFARVGASSATPARPDTCAVIAAGGLGMRFGDPRGKQYVELCGMPVLDWSIAAFDEAPSVGHIVVVCPEGREAETRAAVRRLGPSVSVNYVPGGATRQESCLAGLEAVPPETDFVAIHDGARPLITPEVIEAVIARVRNDGSVAGAICAHPSADTLKVVEDDIVVSTPDRSRYWAVQTPQVFRLATALEAHRAAATAGFVGTDDASLVERLGLRVACVESPSDNMKVTVPEDRGAVEAILSGRLARRAASADRHVCGGDR